jgi:hypothetical protein
VGGALLLLPALVHAQDASSPFKFYGQINLGVLTVDDGVSSDSIFTDNDNSNSRIGFTYDTEFSNGNQLRFNFETAIGLTGSSGVTASNDNFTLDPRQTDLRKFELIYTTQVGKFSFGQGSVATDGIAEQDLSKTSVITYSSLQDIGGGNTFRLSDGTVSSVRINQAFSAFDGGRRLRLRYDTPAFAGFTVAASYGIEVLTEGDNRDFSDISVTYKGALGDFNTVAGIGYASISDGGAETVIGSASIFHNPTGLNFTIAAGQNQASDANYVYLKAGIVREWLPIGETAIAIDYTDGSNFVSNGSSSDSAAISVVQKVDKWNTELFASYRTFGFDDTSGSSFRDVDTTFFGARWKF